MSENWRVEYEQAVAERNKLIAEVERLKAENKRLVQEIYVLKGLVENANEKTASERMAKTLALSENVALQEGAANMGRINCERHAEITVLKEQLAAKDAEIDALTKALDEATSRRVTIDKATDAYVRKHGNFTVVHDYERLSPASRALCERLFGGGK